ncbi:MAG: DUF1194 domain-containing protein [Aestuariivirgaceae bacterium]
MKTPLIGATFRFAAALCQGAAFLWLIAGSAPACAQTPSLPVALELVIAIDTSASVDDREFALQVEGIARAFADAEVIAAIESLAPSGMAVGLVQWSGPEAFALAIPFNHVYDRRTSKAFGFLVGLTQRRSTAGTTAMADSLGRAAALIEANEFAGDRRVIDVSGDGRNNTPPNVEAVRDHVVASGITINGLAILSDDPRLDLYYRNSLIGGKDAFAEVADGFGEFAQAIRRKLIREIYPPLSAFPLRRHAAAKVRHMLFVPSKRGLRATASSLVK